MINKFKHMAYWEKQGLGISDRQLLIQILKQLFPSFLMKEVTGILLCLYYYSID